VSEAGKRIIRIRYDEAFPQRVPMSKLSNFHCAIYLALD